MDKVCNGQCDGCAYKKGAAANIEPDNRLRAAFAALGGYAFACHDSLGWKPGMDGYPEGSKDAFSLILMSKEPLIKLGVDPKVIERQCAGVRKELRICSGWKSAVSKLNNAGWFPSPAIRFIRRHYAKQAATLIHRMDDDQPEHTGNEAVELKKIIQWFKNESKESRIEISWLFE